MSQSQPWRPQPPSITEPPEGEAPKWELGDEEEAASMEMDNPTGEEKSQKPTQEFWLKRAKDSFRFSTTYVDSNYRKNWDDSIRAFNSLHASDSKYNGELFKKRSNLYRPKTRAVIRKNEAAAAAAFFSNLDVVDVTAPNQSIKEELVSAEVTKQLLQYRLTKTVPWFSFLLGGFQDAQVQGVSCAHVYWRFVERHKKDGSTESVEDKPCLDLIPVENLRIDPSAHWMDPINSSPYIIHLMPMYWCDVKDRMEHPNPKGQRWRQYSAAQVFARSESSDDSTRQARGGVSQDPTQQKRDISDYDIVWVHRHIHRYNGEDYEFYTIASQRLLTDPEPLKDTVWHGHRPYVMGTTILETHKPIPSSLPTITRPLQEEANDVQNQRADNVKFVLNKRWIAKRGKNVDLSSLVRNTPGGITLADDPENDIKEINWPDVTQSAYLEQDRIDGDFSDLAGNFNPMQVTAQRSGRESTNTMRMLQGPSNLLTEYMLKTFVETFVQPVLRQLVMLEQHYETDMVLIALAGQKAQVFQKYGVNSMTDAILDKELTVTVNVGMGATDPAAKVQKFAFALNTYAHIVAKQPPPGVDLKEVFKELMALSGYQDGTRFVIDGSDPALAKAQQQIQQLTRALQVLQLEKHNKSEANAVKKELGHEGNVVKLIVADKKMVSDREKQQFEGKKLIASHLMEQEKNATEREGQVEDRDAGFDQQRQLAAAKEQPKPEKDPLEGVKQVLETLIKGEMKLAQAVADLAKMVHEEHSKPKEEPKPRKGKARLPSGGEMLFEMEG